MCHLNEGLTLYKTLLRIEYSLPHISPGQSHTIWTVVISINANKLMTIKRYYFIHM